MNFGSNAAATLLHRHLKIRVVLDALLQRTRCRECAITGYVQFVYTGSRQ